VYLVDAVRGGSTQYRLWKIANLASGSPSLFGPVFIGGSISIRDPDRYAPGGSGNIGIDTGDARMLQVAGLGNRLHGVHNAGCQFAGGANEVCVRYIQFAVGNTSSGGIAVSLVQQSLNGGGDNWFYWSPSIAVNNSGGAATAFNAASINGFRGVAWAAKIPSSSQFAGATWLAQGACLLNGTNDYDPVRKAYRSGDFSGAAADLDKSSIWVASERSANISGVGCGWQTYIARITP
jgi:hypothetical protein